MFKRYWWMLLAMLPVGALVGLIVSAVITYVMPKNYESEIVVELREPSAASDTETAPMGSQGFKFNFESELEKMKSGNSLGSVVDALELVQRWNVDKQTAIGILKACLSTQRINGTDLVSSRMRHTNKEDARDIAAGVVQAYKAGRLEIDKRDQESAFHELSKQVRDQKDRVEELQKIVATIMKVRGIGVDDKSPVGTESAGETHENAITKTLGGPDYTDMKNDLETPQEILKALTLGRMNAEVRYKTPSESVLIQENPGIAQSPISPNVSPNLTLGLAIGLFLSPLIALPLMWLLARRKPSKSPTENQIKAVEY